ncbi:MAG: hypothetical protein KAI47_16510 [Deltaproteobacteria bacterium]|nr:hypothetical protein [Deltaproteobacteria bacterium]
MRRLALKRTIFLLFAIAVLISSGKSEARLDPLRFLSEQFVRPEIVIVLDTSESMRVPPGASWPSTTGNDCSGQDKQIDICGDQMCTGHESTTTCPADCKLIGDDLTLAAGSSEQCQRLAMAPMMDRMFLAKRALRNILAEFRSVANFGLVTFGQSGYFGYHVGSARSTPVTTAIFLHEWEMRSEGSWTKGKAWDEHDHGDLTDDTPKDAFEVKHVPYMKLAVNPDSTGHPDGIDSLYRAEDRVVMNAAESGEYGGWSKCSWWNPCGAGQGDCDADWECAAGLKCGWNMANAVWGSGPWSSGIDVCVPDPIGTWVYQCKTSKQYVYKRANWSAWGRSHDDGSRTWTYQGTYYTYPAHALSSTSRTQKSAFRGPEYKDGGTLWVHNRFGGSGRYGISGDSSGKLLVPLVEATQGTEQKTFDEHMGLLLNRMNSARAGGLMASGKTPTCKAIDRAYEHIAHRMNGDGDDFSHPDEARTCRPRFVIVLSDGESNGGCTNTTVKASTKKLFDDLGVVSFGMAVPGASPGGKLEMKQVSDCGDDGNCATINEDRHFVSNSEKELVDNLRRVIFEAIEGNYTTSASGVTWSGKSGIEGGVAVTPSTGFPGWKGRLEARDLTKDPPDNRVWAAGEILSTVKTWESRLILSGTHNSSGTGTPFKVFSDSVGTVNTAAIGALWPTALAAKPSDAEISKMIQWLAGKNRNWRLPPIVRSVPASVGPPPGYTDLGDHPSFEASHSNRQRLMYVASNEGLLHAFYARTGEEIWAFLPPHLLPKVYDLYKAGGQDADPRNFKYILASSPRVEDVKIDGQWKTLLVQTDGPGGEDFVALDISEMPTCNDLDPPICSNPADHVKPKILFSSYWASPSVDDIFGETWSVPAIYWNTSFEPRVSMGSGYDGRVNHDGEYYHYFKDLKRPWGTSVTNHLKGRHGKADKHSGGDDGLVPDSVAVVDPSDQSVVKSVYQSDLLGRIWAYDLGETDLMHPRKIVDLTHKEPIHYSPAAVYRSDTDSVILAFASGAYQDDDIYYDKVNHEKKMRKGLLDDFDTKFYIYEDNFNGQADKVWEKKAKEICDLATTDDFLVNCNGGPCMCMAPSARARVVSSPMIARNIKFGDRIEVFLVFYDPPEEMCMDGVICSLDSDCNSWERCRQIGGERKCRAVAIGDSYIFRIVLASDGTVKLAQSFKHENVQTSGLTVVGSGTDITLSVSGRSGSDAGVVTLSGETMVNALGAHGRASVESWHQVR